MPIKTVLRFTKPYSKAIYAGYCGARRKVEAAAPVWARKALRRSLEYFDLVILDHHILRYIHANTHEIAPGVWRSSQPAPYQIRAFKELGIKTVINLRGIRNCGSYRLEAEACRKQGMRLVNFSLRSRGAPEPEQIDQAGKLFREIEYPVLFHCKSGADRAGLMSALYLILHENRPVEEAAGQLSLRYGHIKQAETGILDHFLETYIADNRRSLVPFTTWVQTSYDPKELTKVFRARPWARLLVNGVLRRE